MTFSVTGTGTYVPRSSAPRTTASKPSTSAPAKDTTEPTKGAAKPSEASSSPKAPSKPTRTAPLDLRARALRVQELTAQLSSAVESGNKTDAKTALANLDKVRGASATGSFAALNKALDKGDMKAARAYLHVKGSSFSAQA